MDRLPRTVFFDFDGTLVHYEPDSFDVICDFCVEIGQPVSTDAQRRGRRVQHEYFANPEVRDWLESLPPEEFWYRFNRRLLEALGIQGDLDSLTVQLNSSFSDLEQVLKCADSVHQTLGELRARGYSLGLITNRLHVDRFYRLLDQIGLDGHFDVVLASGEVGMRKPDPAIFQIAMEKADVSAGEALYVGDNYWADVVGAERAGMTPVLLDPWQLFPEAECLVLGNIDELLAWLP